MSFINLYGRSFGTKEEYNFRLNVFLENLKKIDDHNNLNSTSTAEVNHFSDWTDEEFNRLLGHKDDDTREKNFITLDEGQNGGIDWRN